MLLNRLDTERLHPESRELDRLPTADLVALMNTADAFLVGLVSAEIPRISNAVDAISRRLASGGRLFYIGAGTSGRLGVLDAAECPPTFGVPPDLVVGIIAGGERALRHAVEAVEDDASAGTADLASAGCGQGDAVVGISASGRTPYVLGAMAHAGQCGALTCGLSCNRYAELSKVVTYPIELATGPEILAGSTRLRAGTATKMALNMISTAVLVRLGHVYGNLMVNVQPTNQKLADRARRIIEQAANIPPERAAELLATAGSVRTAIVMEKKQVSREEAERLLAAAGGRIREALERG